MPRKPKSKLSMPSLKKMSLTSLIALLLYALFELSQQAITTTNFPTSTTAPVPATRLPASQTPVEFYSNQTQDDLTHLYVSAIQSAQQSITFVIYALMDPQVIQALADKSEAGIPVYLVVDAKASPGVTKKLPKAHIVRRMGQGLTHQKILIIDDKQIIAGSANMTTESLRTHGNLVLGLDNPALAQALANKIKSMDEDGGYTPLLHKETVIGSQNIELWVLPDDQGAVKRMIDLFRSAKKSIKVAMFTWTRVDFTNELIEAAKRGVKVETVLDRYSGKGASAKIVKLLNQAGIPVRLSTGQGLLHHKFAYIDDNILVNGSANWTNSAFKNNDDYFIVIYPLTPQQKNKMNQLWQALQKKSEPATF
jgi:cardiolipin synthase